MNRYKILIIFFIVMLLLAAISIAADWNKNEDTSVNGNSSKDNLTSETAEKVNNSNISAGPVSISLEKPPFIE